MRQVRFSSCIAMTVTSLQKKTAVLFCSVLGFYLVLCCIALLLPFNLELSMSSFTARDQPMANMNAAFKQAWVDTVSDTSKFPEPDSTSQQQQQQQELYERMPRRKWEWAVTLIYEAPNGGNVLTVQNILRMSRLERAFTTSAGFKDTFCVLTCDEHDKCKPPPANNFSVYPSRHCVPPISIATYVDVMLNQSGYPSLAELDEAGISESSMKVLDGLLPGYIQQAADALDTRPSVPGFTKSLRWFVGPDSDSSCNPDPCHFAPSGP